VVSGCAGSNWQIESIKNTATQVFIFVRFSSCRKALVRNGALQCESVI
jgi:hypothetical protein